MRLFIAFWGLLCLALAGLNLFLYLEAGHHWFSLIVAFLAVGAGLFDLYMAGRD
jgi:hypothetical protein